MRTDDEAELVEECRARLRDSVRAHLVSDVPVGVLLSGGVDSGLLAALAARRVGRAAAHVLDRLRGGLVRRAGRRPQGRRRATAPTTTSSCSGPTPRCCSPRSPRPSTSRSRTRRRCPPTSSPSSPPRHVKVALSGEGGDELFGGYYTYAADLLAPRVGALARVARPLVELLPSSSAKASFDYRAKRFVRAAHLPPLERHHGWKEIFAPELRAELTGGANGFDPVELYRRAFAETEGAELLARLQDVDRAVYLVDDLLVKTDRASMAHSLEARVPFCDPVVASFAHALPTRHKLRGLRKKVLLRKAAEPLLPRSIVYGRKRGFSIPAAAWLRGELEPFARDVLAPETLRRQGFFEPRVVARLLDDHVARREDRSRQLWGLLAFTLWHERHVERTPGRPRVPEQLLA